MRDWVELGLKEGRLKAVVATSSLDLGVDFLPVERVLQIGSAKGVARLLQRAGRSGHAPGRASRITLVPTNTLELVEAVAARRAALAGRIEKRATPDKPFDVLVQHLVTIALGGGFTRRGDVRGGAQGAWAYRELTRDEFQWALDFVVKGGASLHAYPEYHRVVAGADGVYRVPDRAIARRHKLNVGTIVSDASMQVKYLSGGAHRRGRGRLRRAPEEGRLLRLRRPHARVRARRGDDRLRPARRRQEGVHDRLGRRQDAALERARRLGARGARRRRAGRLLRPRAARRRGRCSRRRRSSRASRRRRRC